MPLEVFADNPSTTVASGKTAVAAGTTETWAVGSNTGWPAADPTANPATVFHVADPAAGTESILVTDNRTTSWSVTRGADSTTPVTHSAGFTIQQVVTPSFLTGLDVRQGIYNAKVHFGCKGDGKQVSDGAMTSGTATLTSATAAFTAADVGKNVLVQQATSTLMRLAGRVKTFNSATSVDLTVKAAITNTGLTMVLDGIRTVADAATTSNSVTVTSATMAFTANDVGKAIYIENANTVALNTTITGFTNSTTVTLNANATRTCSSSLVTYGTDDTTAIINAFTWAGTANAPALYFPASMYLATPSHIGVNAMNIPSNTRVFGDGWDTIIRSTGNENPATRSFELWGINTGSGGTTDPAANVNNVVIERIQFQGTQIEEGFLENGCNLLSLNAASDVIVRDCKFYNSRSDGLYIGSGTTGSVERHNERIRVEDCLFDGVANQCRNGVSIIDGTDVTIDRCGFTSWANELMPGAIDSEPNDFSYVRLRGIRITNCSFTMIGGNQAVASIFLNTPADWFTTPHKGWIFSDNYIYNCLSSTTGILLFDPNYPSDVTPRLDAIISNNVFRGNSADNTGLGYCADFEGVRGVRLSGNFFDVTQQSLIIGTTYKCRDIEIYDNTFKDVSGTGGKAIELARGDQIVINNNIFDHVSPVSSGGYVTRFINAGSSLATPTGSAATPSNSGGSLTAAHGAYGYRVAAFLDDGSTTVAAAEVTATIASGTTGSITVSWTPVYGAKGYNVYGRTVGGELLMTPSGIAQPSTPVTTVSFLDTGSVTPSGALPSASSTNGHSSDVRFTNNIVRQGSSNNTNNISNLVAGHVVNGTLTYYSNQIPTNATLPIAPFTASDQPPDTGLGPAATSTCLGETMPGSAISGSAVLPATATLALYRIWLPAGVKISNINFAVGGTAGATMTHQWWGLLDSTGKQAAHTADGTSAALGASTWFTKALVTAYTTTYTGYYYVVMSISASTMPTLAGSSFVAATSAPTPQMAFRSTSTQTTPGTDGSTTYTLTGGTSFAMAYFYLT